MKVLTCAEMRAVEQAAVDGGIAYSRLMENAGSAAARLIRTEFAVAGRRVAILCGRGNNGGDGFVIARKLLEVGAYVTVVLTAGQPKTEEATLMLSRIQPLELTISDMETEPFAGSAAVQEANLIIDAVYGIGFHGELPDAIRPLFRQINGLPTPVIAVDVPSGLNADTGEADAHTVRAYFTITFTAMKTGLAAPGAEVYSGQVRVASIGIDECLDAAVPAPAPDLPAPSGSDAPEEITHGMVAEALSAAGLLPRRADTHKGDYGRLLTLCGSAGGHTAMPGAAVLAARAALRCGAGLVTCALPRSLYPIAAVQLPEPVFCLLDETGAGDFAAGGRAVLRERLGHADALLAGCGLGRAPGAAALVADLLEQARLPVVLDADGINIAAEHMLIGKTVHRAACPLVITPHPGEMARLTGLTAAEVQADRAGVAGRFAAEHDVVVVLKGHRTLIAAPGQPLLVNPTGNPGMATGGSGDVLAGMIASLLAQGAAPRQAALCGVYLHGLAGDRAAARLSQAAMLPSDMVEELGGLWLSLQNEAANSGS